ncbi:MAG: hypothetical protein M1832_003409 [Thelocarpon impressellum]|nr:MAG: hypothetical protein M1832_003409 [Thelocarpon impressellum]
MLEYFGYKKIKKHQQAKHEKSEKQETDKKERDSAATLVTPSPVLSPKDEEFLEAIVDDEAPAPPLPTRPVLETGDPAGNDQQVVLVGTEADEAERSLEEPVQKSKGKSRADSEGHTRKKSNRFSFLHRSGTKKDKKEEHVAEDGTFTPNEAAKEQHDISAILDNLNLSAVNNKAFSMSKESQALVQKFTVVLKDLVNGVPTAYDDLVKLLDDSQDQLQKHYKELPSYLQKLIKTLPGKLSSSLAPELLATAAATEGASAQKADMKSAAAKAGLRVPSLKDMITKPGAVVGILKAIMNFLKLRWPAFIGTNVLWSLGLFVLLFVFWYCHKRGREVRLAQEKLDAEGVSGLDDDDRFTELSSDDGFDDIDGTPTAGGSSRSGGDASGSADYPSLKR